MKYDREKEKQSHINFLKNRCFLLSKEESMRIRNKFIDHFVDVLSKNFKIYSEQLEKFGFYEGYLWGVLKKYKRVTQNIDLDFLNNIADSNVYAMSDLHTKKRLGNSDLLLPFFPVDIIITAKLKDILTSLAALSQDVYIFDDTFSWYLILTHEWDKTGHEIYYQNQVV